MQSKKMKTKVISHPKKTATNTSSDRRCKLISEIMKHSEQINANKITLVFLLATMTDKGLTVFHKEFLNKK